MHPRRDQDNLGTIACWSRRYDFNDPNVHTHYNGVFNLEIDDKRIVYYNFENISEGLRNQLDAAVVLPIYKYEHGGVALSTESFISRAHHAEWDSGQVGFIFVTKEKLRQEYGVKRITKKVIETATCVLKAEVDEYSEWLNS